MEVTVHYHKYSGALHWHYRAQRLGEDRYGVWLGVPAGAVLRRGSEAPVTMERGFVQSIAPGRWWTLLYNHEGHRVTHYIDVIRPPQWHGGDLVTMVDLDLDVVRRRDGNIELEDEDEFDHHRRLFGYPDWMAAKARGTAAALMLALEANREPFAATCRAWLAEFAPTVRGL